MMKMNKAMAGGMIMNTSNVPNDDHILQCRNVV